MNHRLVLYYLGFLSLCLAGLMSFSVVVGLWYHDGSVRPLLEAMGMAALLGVALVGIGWQSGRDLFRREALAVVGLGWFLAAGLSSLPFYLSGEPQFARYADCFFEAMSGLTTTGSSILGNIEAVAPGLLFWRSFLHWLGGMGIIVLFIAVLPFLGVGGKALFRGEVPGPVNEGLTPRIKQTAVVLWRIYLGMTIVQTILLLLLGMNLFEALCHTFGTLATGGFSTRNTSIAAYNSLAIECVIIFFMIAAGTNFSLHFQATLGRGRVYWKDPEFRTYIGLLLGATLLLTLNQWVMLGHRFFSALREAAFTVVSIMTTTGYATGNFEDWTPGSRLLLLMLMFIGGCGGSTGGGIKVIRWLILFKIARQHILQAFSPRAVRQVKIGGSVVDPNLQRGILIYFALTMICFLLATLLLSQFLPEQSITTCATAVIATLNNIGPGLEAVGPMVNYAFLPASGKWLLSFCMVLGRLELLSVLVLFAPGFWSRR